MRPLMYVILLCSYTCVQNPINDAAGEFRARVLRRWSDGEFVSALMTDAALNNFEVLLFVL